MGSTLETLDYLWSVHILIFGVIIFKCLLCRPYYGHLSTLLLYGYTNILIEKKNPMYFMIVLLAVYYQFHCILNVVI